MKRSLLIDFSVALSIVTTVLTFPLSAGVIAAEPQRHDPILIPGVQEPDEMRVEPFPTNTVEPSAAERMLMDAFQNSDNSKPATLLPALNQIITQYPDFPDAYMVRAFALCDAGSDLSAIAADLDRAIKSVDAIRTGKGSLASLLSMRAKIEYANGDYNVALNDLEKAIRADLTKADAFANSGAVKPEQSAPVCIWTEPDMNSLVKRFPADYRAYVMRGLYYSFFTRFSSDEALPNRAADDFRRAVEKSPGSTLPHYFAATSLLTWGFLKQINMSDEQRRAFYRAQLDELTKALVIDPAFQAALVERANVYYSLKQFRQAIADWDRVIELNPSNSGAYNDRALAKMELGDAYDAIFDFDKAIQNQERQLLATNRYQARAHAYMKTRQWDRAIRDLTTAISLQIGGASLLMTIDQFRAIYPEYKSVSDEAIARKLIHTFYPNLKIEANNFFKDSPMASTVIPDLYVERADAYLQIGNWRRASIDFRRAVNGFPGYAEAIERWREISPLGSVHNYIDMKTFDDGRSNAIRFWIKQIKGSNDSIEPYSLHQFELNCQARQIRTVAFVNYDASGDVINSREGGNWASVIPATLGEALYNGACGKK